MNTEKNGRREELLSDLEGLVTFLAKNEGVPLRDFGVEVEYYVGSDDDQVGIEEIQRIAAALGVEMTVNDDKTHYRASRRFGTASYKAVYVVRREMDDYHELMDLGRRAQREAQGGESE
ncbi:hypothetical protein Drose_04545 [Dactylosporangium roseum]|uniref:Uncharacterized protein n=1 Tax=Dactylosporangium roseum TaxID=47989 RepID=A0ABY5ZB15_9ACTN|nr:hypothetical protein [Dactylosporangium roseum]UWZ37559.1 hypothetical protein Drose_04545 [Dactylosporangium roseum]